MTEVEAFRRCVCRTYIELARGAPGSEVSLEPGVWLARSAIRHPIGNFAINFQGDHLPSKVVVEAQMRPFFRAFFLEGDRPQNICDLARSHGLRERYALAGMVLDSRPGPGIEVERANTASTALEIAQFITDTFFWRSPPKNRQVLAEIMACRFPNHEFYSIRDESGIISAGTLTVDAEVIGLYNICVRVDARSQGIGAGIVARLGALAIERSNQVVLTCDQELVPWYSRQGYKMVGSLSAFST